MTAVLKKFSIAISMKAHRKLRDHAERFGLGNNDILTIMLENVPASAFEQEATALVEERRGRAAAGQLLKQVENLTPAERERLLKFLQGDNS